MELKGSEDFKLGKVQHVPVIKSTLPTDCEEILIVDKEREKSIIVTLFEHRNAVKIHHFNTKKYGIHKTLDTYLHADDDLFLIDLLKFTLVPLINYLTIYIKNT